MKTNLSLFLLLIATTLLGQNVKKVIGTYIKRDAEMEDILTLSKNQSFKLEYSDDAQFIYRFGIWQLNGDSLTLFVNKNSGSFGTKAMKNDTLKFVLRNNKVYRLKKMENGELLPWLKKIKN